MNRLILLVFIGFAVWMIRKDIARRDGVSRAIWIPTLWAGILASRPLSTWVGFGGGDDSLEGSPVDRLFYFVMIFAAWFVLARRRINWGAVISKNWPILLYYGYFLISVGWADSPVSSFKRWFKDFGNVAVALVILTEVNPEQAFRAVFARCACVLIPLSIIFIRYFPDLGRRYNMHSGEMEAIGVTFQKNSLGAMVLVCGMVLFWDWLEQSRAERKDRLRAERLLPYLLLGIGAWLLHLSDAKTSILCLLIGAAILSAVKMPLLRSRINALGIYLFVGLAAFFLLDWLFGISQFVVSSMGRDMTFTGRTEVWAEILKQHTDPIFGTGFCSFWSDEHYKSRLPEFVAYSCHNGYLETYVDGGWIAVFFLSVLLIATIVKTNLKLSTSGSYGLLQLAVILVTLIGDFSESHFARMSPLWFLFLLIALDRSVLPQSQPVSQANVRLDDEPVVEWQSSFQPPMRRV